MVNVTYISGVNLQKYEMIFDGFIDDGKSDFISFYRFINCSAYLKHVYFTFPRGNVVRIKEIEKNDKKFNERFANL